MSYFIFDLDGTLAEIYTVYYFVASLCLEDIKDIPESLANSLYKAYKKFVEKIVEEEIKNPLGILRPGILNVMSKLYELQNIGRVKNIIIYSNNGCLYSVEFIRDLIHEYIGTRDLIGECIHRYHYMRNDEIIDNNPTKTWNVLKNIMIHGKTKARNVKQSDIYFFDDLDHKDLQTNLDNYYQVPEYKFKASFNRVAKIYKDVLSNADIDTEFIEYCGKEFAGDSIVNNIDDLIEIFRNKTNNTGTKPPKPDIGIEMMMDSIKKIGRLGGKRKRY